MSEENQTQDQTPAEAADQTAQQLDPAFFTCVNEYLELTNKQSKEQGLKRISMASMYAASRFNAHVYLANVSDPAAERKEFLDYMTRMYRRMLNENLDGLGAERGVNVGDSELASEYAEMAQKAGVSPITRGE